jgi:hypothetical protein
MESGHHGSHGTSQEVSHLLIGEPFDIGQEDGDTELGGEFLQRSIDIGQESFFPAPGTQDFPPSG